VHAAVNVTPYEIGVAGFEISRREEAARHEEVVIAMLTPSQPMRVGLWCWIVSHEKGSTSFPRETASSHAQALPGYAVGANLSLFSPYGPRQSLGPRRQGTLRPAAPYQVRGGLARNDEEANPLRIPCAVD
jgi:hypothetical protein